MAVKPRVGRHAGVGVNPPFAYLLGYQAATRLMFAQVLQGLGFVCRPFPTIAALCADLDANNPPLGSLMLLDSNLPSPDILAGLQEIRNRALDLPGIVTAAGISLPLAREALRAGARDLLVKPISRRQLTEAVRRIQNTPASTGRIATLSRRERQVFVGLLNGLGNKEIARELSLGVRTIEDYRANLMAKLDAHSLAELLQLGLQLGIWKGDLHADKAAELPEDGKSTDLQHLTD